MMKYVYLIAAMILTSGCADTEQASHTQLLGTTWNLAELNNGEIQYSGSTIPHLRFETERVSGNDGCNNFFGGYTLDGNSLKFGMLASTRMACPKIRELDIEFNKMISATTRYQINGNKLELFENDELLANFLAAEQS
jgi:heat shock protein HslJ